MATTLKCNVCDQVFARKRENERHINTNHQCLLCKNIAKNKNELKNYKIECELQQLLKHRCVHCGRIYTHKNNHEKHEAICGEKS